MTDSNGLATFDTIYPGWYIGRATHIHLRVRFGGVIVNSTGFYLEGHISHTGQLFFNETLTDLIATQAPYSSHNITRTRIDTDGIYQQSNGALQLVSIQYKNPTVGLREGLVGIVTVGVHSSSTPDNNNMGGGGTRPPPFI
ncbi:unnamed protein product, partial [Didymodactylos carnosus]